MKINCSLIPGLNLVNILGQQPRWAESLAHAHIQQCGLIGACALGRHMVRFWQEPADGCILVALIIPPPLPPIRSMYVLFSISYTDVIRL